MRAEPEPPSGPPEPSRGECSATPRSPTVYSRFHQRWVPQRDHRPGSSLAQPPSGFKHLGSSLSLEVKGHWTRLKHSAGNPPAPPGSGGWGGPDQVVCRMGDLRERGCAPFSLAFWMVWSCSRRRQTGESVLRRGGGLPPWQKCLQTVVAVRYGGPPAPQGEPALRRTGKNKLIWLKD